MQPLPRLFSKPLGMLPVLLLLAAVPTAIAQGPAAPTAPGAQIWRFDRLDSIGGFTTQVLGHPQIIETPYGKAIQFNGVNDALFVADHPLAGASTYTWEVIFRPDGGAFAQRFFQPAGAGPGHRQGHRQPHAV